MVGIGVEGKFDGKLGGAAKAVLIVTALANRNIQSQLVLKPLKKHFSPTKIVFSPV
jgi:hypothetical protein